MTLTSDQIFGTDDFQKPVKLKVPEWNGEVFIKMMSGEERDVFEFSHVDSDRKHFRARLAVFTCVDEQGRPIFKTDEDTIAKLSKKSASALTRIFATASKINKLSQQDIEDLGNE